MSHQVKVLLTFFIPAIEYPIMPCPRCSSDRLGIRQKSGLESLWILVTGMRKFHCLDCDKIFRAPDRRKKMRSAGAVGWDRPQRNI
jgi:DNA-directed RNA polymerase subunit RPC12/RpoP